MDLYIKGRDEVSHVYASGALDQYKEYDNQSNMQCEWYSLTDAMTYCFDNSIHDINIFTDSLFLFKQLTHEYRIKSKKLKPIYFQYNQLKNEMSGYCITYFYCSGYENCARSGCY